MMIAKRGRFTIILSTPNAESIRGKTPKGYLTLRFGSLMWKMFAEWLIFHLTLIILIP